MSQSAKELDEIRKNPGGLNLYSFYDTRKHAPFLACGIDCMAAAENLKEFGCIMEDLSVFGWAVLSDKYAAMIDTSLGTPHLKRSRAWIDGA